MPPHRSAKQRALATKNLALIHGQKPTQLPCEGENVDPNPDIQDEKITELEAALAKMKKRGDRYAKNARNKTKEVARAKRSRDILREENYRHEHNLKMRGYRAPLQRQKLVEKTLRKTGVVPDVVFLKEKGVVKDKGVPAQESRTGARLVSPGFGREKILPGVEEGRECGKDSKLP